MRPVHLLSGIKRLILRRDSFAVESDKGKDFIKNRKQCEVEEKCRREDLESTEGSIFLKL